MIVLPRCLSFDIITVDRIFHNASLSVSTCMIIDGVAFNVDPRTNRMILNPQSNDAIAQVSALPLSST